MFPGARVLTMPSLKNHGSLNKLCEVIQTANFSETCKKAIELIYSLKGRFNNFILICEDAEAVE